jgi:hypothetical protein
VHYDDEMYGVGAYGRDDYEWFKSMSNSAITYVPSYEYFQGKNVTKFEVFMVWVSFVLR